MRFSAPVLLISLAALTAGCEHAPGYPPNPIVRPTEITDFSTVYSENCAACHGANGQNGPAIDLGNPEYQALVDDATLRKWISGGMPGTEMPAFAQSAGGMLTDAQVNALIAGMRRQWSQPNLFARATPPPYAQAQTGDAHSGEQSYQSRCAVCHTSSRQQITSLVYLALVGDQALRSIIIAGRPDIGQPDWRHDTVRGEGAPPLPAFSGGRQPVNQPDGDQLPPLSAQDVDNIVAYLASLRSPAPAKTGNAAPMQPALAEPTGR
jgi:cytochrome c oxidase cbb3-type subunit 3